MAESQEPTNNPDVSTEDGAQAPETGGEGSQDQANNTMSYLRKDLRGHELLQGFGNASEIAEAYVKAKTADNTIIIPGEDADEETVKAYREKMGIPASKDGYQFEEELPKEVDASMDDWIKDVAHNSNLTQQQAADLRKSIIGRYQEQAKQYSEQREQQLAQMQNALKEKWGANFEKNQELARRVVKTLGTEEFWNYLDSTGLGDDPRMIEAMHTFGSMISEDTLVDGSADSSTPRQNISYVGVDPEMMEKYYPDKPE